MLSSLKYINWITPVNYYLDHAFHLHSDLIDNSPTSDRDDSSLRLPKHLGTTKSELSIQSRENIFGKNANKRFTLFLGRISKLINYHRNIKKRCLLRIVSSWICFYLIFDVIRSIIVSIWIRKGYISQDCLNGEVCNPAQRKLLFWIRISDLLVVTTNSIPEIHILSILISVSAVIVTLYFTFIRDIQDQSENAAILYLKLLRCHNIHGPDKKEFLSTKDDLDLDFDYNDFYLKGPSVRGSRWKIRKKTLVFINKLINFHGLSNILCSILIWIYYSVLSLFFYWKINKVGITLEEEELNQDFRPFATMRILLSLLGVASKIIYENVFLVHFLHHMLCCIILKERIHATAMQSKNISQYLINYKHIIKQLYNEGDNCSNEFRLNGDYLKDLVSSYSQPDMNISRPSVCCVHMRTQERSSIQQQELSKDRFKLLIRAALDENFRCISAVRKELADLRLHFMPFLTAEIMTKIPISIIYLGNIAFTRGNENTNLTEKVFTLLIVIILASFVSPIVIMTGVVQKSVSSTRRSNKLTNELSHNCRNILIS